MRVYACLVPEPHRSLARYSTDDSSEDLKQIKKDLVLLPTSL